jgi:hypothetical protein
MVQVYGLSTTAQEQVATASRIAAEIALPNAADVDLRARFPTESIKALAEAGLNGLCLPESVGGKGEGMRAFAGVVEELAGACGSTAMIYVMLVLHAHGGHVIFDLLNGFSVRCLVTTPFYCERVTVYGLNGSFIRREGSRTRTFLRGTDSKSHEPLPI